MSYVPSWKKGPIGPGWLMMFVPLEPTAIGIGAGGMMGKEEPKLKKKHRKPHRHETEILALLMLTEV